MRKASPLAQLSVICLLCVESGCVVLLLLSPCLFFLSLLSLLLFLLLRVLLLFVLLSAACVVGWRQRAGPVWVFVWSSRAGLLPFGVVAGWPSASRRWRECSRVDRVAPRYGCARSPAIPSSAGRGMSSAPGALGRTSPLSYLRVVEGGAAAHSCRWHVFSAGLVLLTVLGGMPGDGGLSSAPQHRPAVVPAGSVRGLGLSSWWPLSVL